MYKYSKNNLVNSTNSYKTIYKKYKWPESIERWSNCPIWRSRNYGRPSPYLNWACLPLGWAWSVFHRTLRMLPGLFLKVYQKQNSLGPHSWELHYGWCNLPVLQEQKHRSGPPCASGRSCALGFRKPEIKVRPGLVCASDKDLTVRPSMCFRKELTWHPLRPLVQQNLRYWNSAHTAVHQETPMPKVSSFGQQICFICRRCWIPHGFDELLVATDHTGNVTLISYIHTKTL